MKTLLLPALLFSCFFSVGQNSLEGGIESPYTLVQKPYFFYDQLRTEHPAWITQYRKSETSSWTDSMLTVTQTDDKQRLIFLRDEAFNSGSDQPERFGKWNYSYANTNGNLSKWNTEARISMENSPELLVIDDRNELFYSDNNLVRVTTKSFDNSRMDYVLSGQQTFSYDEHHKRIAETISTTDARYTINYEYDQDDHCTAAFTLIGLSDTIGFTRYEYTNDYLSKVSNYGMINGTERRRTSEYIYYRDSQGRITSVHCSSGLKGPDFNLLPTFLYKQGYTADNKLQWICAFEWRYDKWSPLDSIYISFNPDGKPDTSYGFRYLTSKEWKKWPEFRLVFDETLATSLRGHGEAALSFGVYPNPANDLVMVELPDAPGTSNIVVTDLLGNTVITQTGSGTTSIITGNLRPGIYMMKVESNGKAGIRKLVITH